MAISRGKYAYLPREIAISSEGNMHIIFAFLSTSVSRSLKVEFYRIALFCLKTNFLTFGYFNV